jgi:hypothetical protein
MSSGHGQLVRVSGRFTRVPPSRWLTSCPPTALKEKNKNIQVVRLILIHFVMLIQIPFGSRIAFHDNKMVHRHGYVHLSTHTNGSLHVTSNRTDSDGSRLRPPPHTHSKESSTVRAKKPMGRQYQTAQMKLMIIMSCSSINSHQHVTAIKNQDSSLKAVLLPRISTFGACSCRSLHHKTVSLTIRCSSTSKQGSQKQKLTTSKHISPFSHCQKTVSCT